MAYGLVVDIGGIVRGGNIVVGYIPLIVIVVCWYSIMVHLLDGTRCTLQLYSVGITDLKS